MLIYASVAIGRAGERSCPYKHVAPGRDARARRDEAGCHRRVKGQYPVLLRFFPEQILQLLQLRPVLGGHVLRLGPVLSKVIQFPGADHSSVLL